MDAPCDMKIHSRINQVNHARVSPVYVNSRDQRAVEIARQIDRMLAHPGLSRPSTPRCRCDQLIVSRRKSPTPARPGRHKRPRSCDHFPRQCQTTQPSPAKPGFRRRFPLGGSLGVVTFVTHSITKLKNGLKTHLFKLEYFH